MDDLSQKWMAYIDTEVREACSRRGFGYQVRRKWTVREKPVSASPVDDYEWKLLTGDRCDRDRPDLGTDESDEGRYYLLELDRARGKFILHHDNHYGGDGSFLHLATFTEIRLGDPFYPDLMRVWGETEDAVAAARFAPPPPPGWLCDTLVDLTNRLRPNWFTIS
jgi:hypothetical protein